MSDRHVDTAYDPMPGCPDCGVVKLGGEPHICEHGVTPSQSAQMVVGAVVDAETYQRLLGYLRGAR